MLDPSLRAKVLEQMARALPEDGWLILGRDETAEGVTEALEPIDGWTGVFARSPKFRAAA
jgi:chemotaxis protein methyltransferase CheR